MDLVLLKMGRFSKKMVSLFAKSGDFAAWAACCDVFRQDGGSSSFFFGCYKGFCASHAAFSGLSS